MFDFCICVYDNCLCLIYCSKRYRVVRDLIKTYLFADHDKEKEEPYICDICNSSFSKKNNLDAHVATIHDSKKEQNSTEEVDDRNKYEHVCFICNAKFSDSNGIKRHIQSVHEKKRPHICDICNKGFTRESEVRIHKEAVHEGKKPHVCDFCNKSFSRKNHLNVHIAAVHEKQEKEHACELCDYA